MEQEDDSPFHFTERDTMLEWKCRTDRKKYYRYYRIYQENEPYEIGYTSKGFGKVNLFNKIIW